MRGKTMSDGIRNKFETTRFDPFSKMRTQSEEIVSMVMAAMNEKGYNPVNQLVGFIISGDPTYITSHKGARSLIMKVDRDTLLEEIVEYYITHNEKISGS